MMDPQFFKSILCALICGVTLLTVVDALRGGLRPINKALLGFMMAASVFMFSNFGDLLQIRKDSPEFVKEKGTQVKSAWFHWHEIYHYYLGAKYFPQLGYKGLYYAFYLADLESPNPMITVDMVRDAHEGIRYIDKDEALHLARTEFRPKFSDEEWEQFVEDVQYMKSVAMPEWPNLGMFDAGFNPPPSWNVIGHTLAWVFPLSQEDAWFDYGPLWDQSQFLTLLDIALLLVACAAIYRSFGYLGLSVFVITFCVSFVSSPHWVMGSFLRHIWLFGLVMCLCMLKKERYFAAGVYIGLSTLMRVFPVFFALGFLLALLIKWRWQGHPSFDAIKRYVAGGVCIAVIVTSLSLAMFGWDKWREFAEDAIEHNNVHFIAHIGYRKVVQYDESWVPRQNFWHRDGVERFYTWNQRLLKVWDEKLPYHFPFLMLLIGASVWLMRRLTLEEGGLLFGSLVIFSFLIPANYYYSYFALLPVVFVMGNALKNQQLVAAFFTLWAAVYYMPNLSRDDIVYTYYICTLFLAFLLLWLFIRLIDLSDFSSPEAPVTRQKNR